MVLTFVVLWFLCGIFGYVAMYYCDTATNLELCNGHFYVVDKPVWGFVLALLFAPIALGAGWNALEEWRDHTLSLAQELDHPAPAGQEQDVTIRRGGGSHIMA